MLSFKHVFSLFVVSAALWLVLSGHIEPLLLSLGAVSAVLTVVMALRMEVIDHESHPIDITWRLLTYWLWLGKEVIKSNFVVARHILSLNTGISPTVAHVATGQRTDIGRAIFANSITLTPGTVALNVEEEVIEVHALTHAAAEELHSGTMSRRVPDPGEHA